jgi:diacylglycerol kinase
MNSGIFYEVSPTRGKGIKVSIQEQRNLKVQAIVALTTVGAGFYFDITSVEWCLILLTIALVMGLEMMNSAVEGLVDVVSPDYKPLAGKVKDIAAGAVLFAAILSVIIGVLIFRKYIVL